MWELFFHKSVLRRVVSLTQLSLRRLEVLHICSACVPGVTVRTFPLRKAWVGGGSVVPGVGVAALFTDQAWQAKN